MRTRHAFLLFALTAWFALSLACGSARRSHKVSLAPPPEAMEADVGVPVPPGVGNQQHSARPPSAARDGATQSSAVTAGSPAGAAPPNGEPVSVKTDVGGGGSGKSSFHVSPPSADHQASSAAPPDVDFSELNRIIAGAHLANVVFNVPSTINLGDSYDLHLLLSPTKSVDELQKDLQSQIIGNQNLEGAAVKITPMMEARLTGQNFEITAGTPETQAVSDQTETQWVWDVKAKETGLQQLHLTLSALVTVKGSTTPFVVQTFDRRITVSVTWGQRISSFAGQNWKWLWTTILVPIGGWMWKKWRNERANA
jgi:hypothetical protein